MKPNQNFLNLDPSFWAHVRTISQAVGYTKKKSIHIPSLAEIKNAFAERKLSFEHIENKNGDISPFGQLLLQYFEYRANALNQIVQFNLMNKEEAESIFYSIFNTKKNWSCPLPLNKQKKEKRNYAFLTCIVNMLLEQNIPPYQCDYDPRELTTVTLDQMPLRTLSRRVDGAFPSTINPIAIWEIKEYYYTTTFGSRVADGVYESLLDGMELRELANAGHKKIHHVLIIDSHFTWWECGRSYLCRILDMLHMGFLDEVIFGKEVVHRLPELIQNWKADLNQIN